LVDEVLKRSFVDAIRREAVDTNRADGDAGFITGGREGKSGGQARNWKR
jgi:hypothetical protein